jgi:hypothetical protein
MNEQKYIITGLAERLNRMESFSCCSNLSFVTFPESCGTTGIEEILGQETFPQ